MHNLNFFFKPYILSILKNKYKTVFKRLIWDNSKKIIEKCNFWNFFNNINYYQKKKFFFFSFRTQPKVFVLLKKNIINTKLLHSNYLNWKIDNLFKLSKFFYFKKFIINNKKKKNFFYILKQNSFLFTKINTVSLPNLKNLIILKKGFNFCFKSINLTKRLMIKTENTIHIENVLNNPLSLKAIKFVKKSNIIDLKKQKMLKLKRYCFFKRTKNNTFLTITNGLGEVILRSSAGLVKVKTKKKKRNKETFMLICQELAVKCLQNKIKILDKLIITKSLFGNIFYKLRKIFNRLGLYLKIPNIKKKKKTKYNQYLRINIGFKIVSYHLRNAHNGIRLKKKRRV